VWNESWSAYGITSARTRIRSEEMNDIGSQIVSLISKSGQAAPKITNGLANIGNGNIQNGIK